MVSERWLRGERDEARDEVDKLRAENERLTQETDGQSWLINRQGQLLTAAINAARGEPDELTLWSHHDVAEWVTKLREERDQALAAITRVRERCDEFVAHLMDGGAGEWTAKNTKAFTVGDVLALLDGTPSAEGHQT